MSIPLQVRYKYSIADRKRTMTPEKPSFGRKQFMETEGQG